MRILKFLFVVSAFSSMVALADDCTITEAGKNDHWGTNCDLKTGFCAFYYVHGKVQNSSKETTKAAAQQFCDHHLHIGPVGDPGMANCATTGNDQFDTGCDHHH